MLFTLRNFFHIFVFIPCLTKSKSTDHCIITAILLLFIIYMHVFFKDYLVHVLYKINSHIVFDKFEPFYPVLLQKRQIFQYFFRL